MIAYLRGTIVYKTLQYIVLETGGVGYQVFVNEPLNVELRAGAPIELYIYHHVREEADDLFGFKTPADLEMFSMLLSVSGVGPKSALAISGLSDAGSLGEAIRRGDSDLLTKVSGIGRKTAERIVLDLREKIGKNVAISTGQSSFSISGDEIDALMALGYSLPQARSALRDVSPELKSSTDRIREALKRMAN